MGKKYTTTGIPTEDSEEFALTAWLDANGYTHFHVPQETFTRSWGVKMKSKKLGVRRGVPDHWVIVPTSGVNILVAIEMKRTQGGVISDYQFAMIHKLNDCKGIIALVANGSEEAIEIVELVRKEKWEKIDEKIEKFEKKREKRIKLRKRQEEYEKDNPF